VRAKPFHTTRDAALRQYAARGRRERNSNCPAAGFPDGLRLHSAPDLGFNLNKVGYLFVAAFKIPPTGRRL
jgi:hypothetical protein